MTAVCFTCDLIVFSSAAMIALCSYASLASSWGSTSGDLILKSYVKVSGGCVAEDIEADGIFICVVKRRPGS